MPANFPCVQRSSGRHSPNFFVFTRFPGWDSSPNFPAGCTFATSLCKLGLTFLQKTRLPGRRGRQGGHLRLLVENRGNRYSYVLGKRALEMLGINHGYAVRHLRQEACFGQSDHPPRQGEIPWRRRPESHRHDAPHLQAQFAANSDYERRHSDDRPSVCEVHSQRQRAAAREAQAVSNAHVVADCCVASHESIVMAISTEQVHWVATL